MERKLKRTPHANRPKWAKPLTAKEWKHVCEAQNLPTATLSNLLLDSQTCPHCQWIVDNKIVKKPLDKSTTDMQ